MPILEVFALLLAAVSLLLLWRVTREMNELRAKLDRVTSTIYATRSEIREQQDEIENRIGTLDLAVQKTTGKLRFDPNLSLTRLYEIEPRAQTILAGLHIGGCASCAVDEDSTLAQAVRERGGDLDRVLAALNALPSNGSVVERRTPNVQFEL